MKLTSSPRPASRIPKAVRLRLIRDGIRGLRNDLAQTVGSDRVSEVVMLATLGEAIEGLIWEASRQHSDSGVHPFKVEVIADLSGKWCGNGISFEAAADAAAYAQDLARRWTLVRAWRVTSLGGVVEERKV